MSNTDSSEEHFKRREFLIGGLSAIATSLLLLQGCGGGGHGSPSVAKSEVTSAPTPPDPNEAQHADLVFDGLRWTDGVGNPVDLGARLSGTGAQPRTHKLQTYVYIWQPGWGWHWFYAAYDTGHRFGTLFKNTPQPHLNFDRYSTWSDLQADIKETTNKRCIYDGHFTVYRKPGAICAYYYVSIDKVFHDTGDKYNSCSSGGTTSTFALVAAVILVGSAFANAVAPVFEDILNNLPAFA